MPGKESGWEQRRIPIADNDQVRAVFGQRDENLKAVENGLGVQVLYRGNELTISGEPWAAERAEELFRRLLNLVNKGHALSEQDIRYAIDLAREDRSHQLEEMFGDTTVVTFRGKSIRPKTMGQKMYVDSLRINEMVFAIGPAGTGKTYLAMAVAVAAFKRREVSRIILTRPAVEAGEKLGFLPGDLQEKVDPYLRPLYDALYDILGPEGFDKYMARGMIEVAPLAYMRGRTLDDSYIILDEAQNTTPEQMKMFLTRMGFGSRVVVTGDVTQVDLPRDKHSGLVEVRRVLKDVDGVDFVDLTEKDVVRHPLVQRIIKAYEVYESGGVPAAGSAAPAAGETRKDEEGT